MKRARKRPDDARVNAPLISWKVALSIFGIAYLLLVGQAGILASFLDQIPTLIVVLAHYVVCTCVLLAVLFGVFWRYGIGKPLRILSQAARKVAAGDFSVQIPPVRRDGKKDELEVLIEDFNTMARELAGNEMLKSDFIANVSHEIKTPLSIIQSYTKALKDGCVPEAQKEQYMDAILAASSNLSLMVTNILKLNKLENQRIFPAPESYPLGEQLRLCALGFMERWQEKNIAFSIDVADVTVRYDPSLLELVWNNLLSNAINSRRAARHRPNFAYRGQQGIRHRARHGLRHGRAESAKNVRKILSGRSLPRGGRKRPGTGAGEKSAGNRERRNLRAQQPRRRLGVHGRPGNGRRFRAHFIIH